MRLKLFFTLKTEEITIDYRRKFLSFFKKALEDLGDNAIEKYYSNNISTKDYTFSVYFRGKFNKRIIVIEDKEMVLNFSVFNMKDGIYFTNAFIGSVNKSFMFGNDNEITLKKVEIKNENEIRGSEGEFKILSPIVVKERSDVKQNKDNYYIYNDENWLDILKNNMKFQVKDKFEFDISKDIDELEIVAKEPFVKKTVVENYGIKFQVTIGTIYMKGTRVLLDYLAKAGIGSKRSSGFGMLELM